MSSPKTWTDEQRQIGWIALSYSRRGLRLTISPCIASSYYFLHNFFLVENHRDYDLYILLVSSLFLSCKIEDLYRPLKLVFREFAKSCVEMRKHVPIQKQKHIFGDRDFLMEELSPEEALLVGRCELDLLNAVNWKLEIDLPFSHFNDHKYIFCQLGLPNSNAIEHICNFILRDICLIIKNVHYLEIPATSIAAAAMKHACLSVVLPSDAEQWVQSVEQTNPEKFQLAFRILQENVPQCAPI